MLQVFSPHSVAKWPKLLLLVSLPHREVTYTSYQCAESSPVSVTAGEVTVSVEPEPGVKPAAPYSTCHEELEPAFQANANWLWVRVTTCRLPGRGQETHWFITTAIVSPVEYSDISLMASSVSPFPSITSNETSAPQDPDDQMNVTESEQTNTWAVLSLPS